MPTASFLTKISKMQSAGCGLCTIAREARGKSTEGLADETDSHVKSAGCEGMATVTAAHHSMVCEAHNRVIVSFLPQVEGGTRPTTQGSSRGEYWAKCARVRR